MRDLTAFFVHLFAGCAFAYSADGREAHLVAKLAKSSGAETIADYLQGLIFSAAKNAGIRNVSDSVEAPEWLNRVVPSPPRLIGDGALCRLPGLPIRPLLE
jgi:hypothetical protein